MSPARSLAIGLASFLVTTVAILGHAWTMSSAPFA